MNASVNCACRRRTIQARMVRCAIVAGVIGASAATRDDPPFKVSASLDEFTAANLILNVSVTVAPHHWLYADQFGVESRLPVQLSLLEHPAPESKRDAFSGEIRTVFPRDFRVSYRVTNAGDAPVPVTVRYQGCSQNMCFLPEEKFFLLSRGRTASPAGSMGSGVPAPETSLNIPLALKEFEIVATQVGYLRAHDFVTFLNSGEEGSLQPVLTRTGWSRGITWITFVVILLGGLALNLTPCVLPLIPINLAIIGAGARTGGRRGHGLLLGFLYGTGIALAYGLVGGIVVATGLKFGAVNASPWFNLAVAAVFLVLAMALFDVYFIDLTRIQGPAMKAGRHVLVVLIMGAVSALLAGACVAPVVLSVILLATDLVAKGNRAGMLLPLILGIGMGLPWPLAGAGLSFLPKSGKWMIHVKHGFGVLVLAAATCYAVMGIRLWVRPAAPARVAEGWLASIPEALVAARRESKPVLIDFWASWCKNCHAMDATTLRDEGVRDALRRFVKVKYNADHPNQSPDRELLDQFGVIGLPAYVILKPRSVAPTVMPP